MMCTWLLQMHSQLLGVIRSYVPPIYEFQITEKWVELWSMMEDFIFICHLSGNAGSMCLNYASQTHNILYNNMSKLAGASTLKCPESVNRRSQLFNVTNRRNTYLYSIQTMQSV